MTNNNMYILNRPSWVVANYAPATGVAGTVICDDNERFIYSYYQTAATTAQFWKYDTWFDSYEQLATPATQTGTVASMVYNRSFGVQLNGMVFGSIWLVVGNATTAYFYKYDIATNVWTAMSIANVPATIGTDLYLNYPGVCKNNYATTYHNSSTSNVVNSAAAAVNATTITVTALGEALASGSILRFGYFDITIGATAAKGATTLTVSGVTSDIATGTVLNTYDGKQVILNGAVTSGATSITVYPLDQAIATGGKLKVERFAVLTASAAAAATSITVTALRVAIPITTTAPFYNQMYLVGNSATQMYRYTIGTNVWSTTSSNTSNPALAAVTGAVGAGCALKWLPAVDSNSLFCIRGGATNNIYKYSLSANTWATETFYPNSETFTTGTCVAARSVNGQQKTLYIQKDATMRFYKYDAVTKRLDTSVFQYLMPDGAAVVGDRTCIITSPDGIDFLYVLLHSSSTFVRCALIDS